MDKCTNPTSASLYTQVMGTKTVLKKRRKKKEPAMQRVGLRKEEEL